MPRLEWWWRRDLNPNPPAYKADALTRLSYATAAL